MRRLVGVLGVGVALISLMFVCMAIGDLCGFGDGKTGKDVLFGLLIFFAGTCVSGGLLARWGFTAPPVPGQPQDRDDRIRLILQLAQAQKGQLTLLQVAAETSLSIEESRELLEDLVSQGMAQMQIDEQGVIAYLFPDLRG